MTDAELAERAIEAAAAALPSVSGFPVGAAVLAADGRVFTGCNVESPSLLQVFCAERVAILSALAAGARDIAVIAVHAPKRPDITPCGLCRQMIAEFAPGARILLVAKKGSVKETSLVELLPGAFRL
jgi:cytidine deaminase